MARKVAPKKKPDVVRDWRPKYSRLTKRQLRDFLVALAETGNVAHSCRESGASRRAIYKRARSDPEFAAAFEEAKEIGWCGLEDDTLDLARNGYQEPITSTNRETGETEVIDYKRRHYPALNIFLLKAHNPQRYRERVDIAHGGQGGGPLSLEVIMDPKAVAELGKTG